MWFNQSDSYFCKIESFAYGEINEQNFSNTLREEYIYIYIYTEWIKKIHTTDAVRCNYLLMLSLSVSYIWVYTSEWYARGRFEQVGLRISNYITYILWVVIHFSCASYLLRVQCSNKIKYTHLSTPVIIYYLWWSFAYVTSLTLSQCTLAGPVYTGMPLECHWLTQCTLAYHSVTQRILVGYTGKSLEKLSWNCPSLEFHQRNSDYCSLHWNITGGTITVHTQPDTYS